MTEFERIKKAIESEKQKKIEAQAKMETLNEEKKRITSEIQKILGSDFNIEDLDDVISEKRKEIEDAISKIKSVLEKEGVQY